MHNDNDVPSRHASSSTPAARLEGLPLDRIGARKPDVPGWDIARATDGLNSHEAATDITTSGKRGTHARRLLAAIRANPGGTLADYADLLEISRERLSKRASDLKNKGFVLAGAPRVVSTTGQPNETLWPVVPEVQLDLFGTPDIATKSHTHNAPKALA